MADTGFILPGTAVGNRLIILSDLAWTNPDNIKIDDFSTANVELLTNFDTSDGLAASNFGFGGLIPAGATIDGIEVQVGDYGMFDTNEAHIWNHCHLILADNTDGSENKQAELIDPSITTVTDEAGGATDLWGETITRADVIDVDWGFFLGIIRISGATTVTVDFMAMKVFYTAAGGGGDGRIYRRKNLGIIRV